MLAGTTWQNIIQAAKAQQASESSASDINDRTLLLGGCVDGHIVVFDWKNKRNPGKVVLRIEVKVKQKVKKVLVFCMHCQISAKTSGIQECHKLSRVIGKQIS